MGSKVKVKGNQKERILAYISGRKTPATTSQISKGANVPSATVSARLSEFVKFGSIQRGVNTRKNRVFSN